MDWLKPIFEGLNQWKQLGIDAYQGERDWERQKYMMRKQRQFAKMGIRWKVEDAIKAGLHPLAALGISTHQFSPQHVGGVRSRMQGMGQNISRAMSKMTTPFEREMQKIQLKQAQATLDNMGLRNHALRNEIAEAEAPPMMPVEGDMGLPGQGIVQQSLSDEGQRIKGQKSSYIEPERPRQMKVGVEKNVTARTMAHVGPQGYLWYDPSQTASEGVTEGPGQISFYGQKWAKGIKDIALHKIPFSSWARKARAELRRERSKLQKPPKGMQWHWDVRGQWKLEKANGKFYSNRWSKFRLYRNYSY